MLVKRFNYKSLINNTLLGITLIIPIVLTSCNLGGVTVNSSNSNNTNNVINYGQLTTNIESVTTLPESNTTLIISITGSTANIPTESISISSSAPSIATVNPSTCTLSGTYSNNSCSVTITGESYGSAIISVSAQNYTTKQVTINVTPYVAYVSFLYNGIATYAVNTDTGRWTFLGAIVIFPIFQIAVTPANNYLYAGFNTNLISMYSINESSSLLDSLSTVFVSSGDSPYHLAMDPYGRYLYSANFYESSVSMYKIDSDGILSSLSPESMIASSLNPWSITVDPSGKYVYVLSQTDNSVTIYSIESDSGLLTPISPESTISLGYTPGDITIHQSGKYAYITETSSPGNVHMYDLESDNGILNPMQSESVIRSGNAPNMIIINHSGQYAYTANTNNNTISMYSINNADGRLSSLGIESSAPDSVLVLALDPLDKHLYAGSGEGSSMSIYSVESGRLTQIESENANYGVFRSISIIRRAD